MGSPRRSVGLRPRTNDTRLFLSLFFSAFSARVVLVCLHHAKKHPKRVPLRGGDDQTRTDYLYVANVSLYRVSYIPIAGIFYIIQYSLKIFNRFLCAFKENFLRALTFFGFRQEGFAALDRYTQIVYN